LKGLLNSDSQLIAENSFQLAQANTSQTTSPKTPTAEDYQETPETKITPAIRAKATELENKPWKIYFYVLNNIDYVPTWGSIQGADMCLQTKQCNDTDTASLMIALFRAAGYPARYRYATMQMPIDKFMNWMGGFTDPMAALNFAASAGIPVGGITEGGKITAAQFDHVWAQVRVLYGPFMGMGGVDNIPTWLPLDGSMKFFNYTSGIDIKTAVPFDGQSFIDQIKTSATINETEGYVTNVNSSLVQQTMQDYQTRVQNYISQNYPNSTVGDVIGKKEIIQRKPHGLPLTTMFKLVNVAWTSPTLPDKLSHKVSFSITSDNIYYDSQPMNVTKRLAEIAGKKITLSYAPATSADEAVINSYLPKPHTDGTPIQPSELPSSLPAYLINLKPELRIDGTIVATGGTIGMGEIEDFSITITPPTLSAQVVTNKVTAGEYNAVAFDITRISTEQLTTLKSKLEQTKTKLESQDFTGLTDQDILSDMLYTTVVCYFGELDSMNFIRSKMLGVAAVRLPSVGRFFNGLAIDYVFGVPVSALAGGLSMDIGLIRTLVRGLDGDKNKQLQFMVNSGANSSALEHSVPEKMLSTSDNPAYGISAVKALKLANDQGIPIYTINQSNISSVLPQLQLGSDVMLDIQNAVNAGKVVTVSKRNIYFNGWTGCGYIIVDPTTGAGAYMLGGGLSGGWHFLLWASVFLLVCVLGSISFPLLIAAVIGGALINSIGSQLINISLGLQNSLTINGQTIALGVIGIIAGITLGAGLLALSAAAVPTAVFALAALILYGTAGVFDFLLFWSNNQWPLRRRAYV